MQQIVKFLQENNFGLKYKFNHFFKFFFFQNCFLSIASLIFEIAFSMKGINAIFIKYIEVLMNLQIELLKLI